MTFVILIQGSDGSRISRGRERGSVNLKGAAVIHVMIRSNVPKNCMKMKKSGRGGGKRPKRVFVDPPLQGLRSYSCKN